MKTLRTCILLMLFTALITFGALLSVAQTINNLPPSFNTGNPGAIIFITDNTVYHDGSEIVLQDGAVIIGYWTDDNTGVNHLSNYREVQLFTTTLLTTFTGRENIPDEPDVDKGIPSGHPVKLAITHNDAIYEVTPRKIFSLQGTGEWRETDALIGYPFSLYRVEMFDLIDQSVTLEQVPFLTWRESQCPTFYDNHIDREFQANVVQSGIRSSPTIGRVKHWYLHNVRNFPIHIARADYTPGYYTEVETGNGHIENTGYRVLYHVADADRERGYVQFRVYARRYSGCAMESDPSATVRYNFRFLPNSILPADSVIEPPAPPPPVETKPDMPEGVDYELVIAGNEYFTIAMKADGSSLFVNHLNYGISIQIKEKDAPRWLIGLGLQANTYRERATPNWSHARMKGKTYTVQYSSYRGGIYPAKTFEFEW